MKRSILFYSLLVFSLGSHGDEFKTNALLVSQSSGNTPLDSSSYVSNSGFELNAGTDKKEAVIKISPIIGKNNFSITLKAPLNEETGESAFFTNDGLANSTSLKVNFQRFNALDIAPLDLLELRNSCRSAPDEYGFKTDQECVTSIDNLVASYAEHTPDGNLPHLANQWRNELSKPIKSYGLTAALGTKDYEFINTGTLEKVEETKTPWSVSAYASLVYPGRGMLTLEAEYQGAYKPQKTTTVCPAVADENNLLSCVTASFGAPAEDNNKNISLEFRRPQKVFGLSAAFSPKFTYDFEDDTTSFSLPVFLLQDGKGNLTGGVKAEWDDESKDWEFGVFVGSKFDFNRG